MPARVDLAGQRIGRLTVESFVERVGRDTFWACACDCGARLTERLRNLRTSDPSRRVDACPACRAKACLVCGAPILPERHKPRKTCSAACGEQLRKRGASERHERALMRDPSHYEDRNLARSIRRQTDAAFAAHVSAQHRDARRRKRARMAEDPDYAECLLAVKRASRRRRDADRRTDPEKDAAHKRHQREWRRDDNARKALAEFRAIGDRLTRISASDPPESETPGP